MNLSYCTQQTLNHDRDRFRLSLFVPEEPRQHLHIIYALNTELIGVHKHVSEEMIGHIRYAWWQEKIDELYQGKRTHGHPVLEELYYLVQNHNLPRKHVMALVESYRDHYPEQPDDVHQHLHILSLHLIMQMCPEAEKIWRKAENIILKHRKRYPHGAHAWLSLRLLFAGLGKPN